MGAISFLGRAFGLANKLNKGKGVGGAVNTAFKLADNAGTAIALPILGYQATQLPGGMRESILDKGPNDPYNKDNPTAFKLTLPQQLAFGVNNLASNIGLTEKITPKTLSEDYRRKSRQDVLGNTQNRALMLEAGIQSGSIGKDIYDQAGLDAFLYPKLEERRKVKSLRSQLDELGETYSPDADSTQLKAKLAGSPLSVSNQYATQRRDSLEAKIEDSERFNQNLQLQLAQVAQQNSIADRNLQLQLQQLANADRRYEREDRRTARQDELALYAQLIEGLSNVRFR